MAQDTTEQPLADLPRTLSLWNAITIVVGLVIGSGIFLTTGSIAAQLPDPAWILAVWALGGFLSLTGALTFAELAASLPQAGGQYIYLRDSFGPWMAFLFGWTCFFVIQSGGIAAVGVGFSEYLGYLFPVFGNQNDLCSFTLFGWSHAISAGQVMACCAVALLSFANYVGVRQGTAIQSIFTVAKLAAMAALVIAGLAVGQPAAASFWQGQSLAGQPGLLGAFSVAMVAVLWTYDGWNNLTFVAGETRHPARNLPLALILGMAVVMLVYLVMNAVYLYAMPAAEMRGVVRISEMAMNRMLGPGSGKFVAIAVVLSTLGSINAMLLASARLYYAMARDRLFFSSVGRIHPRHATPGVSLIVQALVTCGLTLTGSYDQLITYVMLAQIFFFMATALAVFILRARRPELPRPYKTWGYPVVPVLYILTLLVIALSTVIERPMESLYGIGLVLMGMPAYWFWRTRSREQ